MKRGFTSCSPMVIFLFLLLPVVATTGAVARETSRTVLTHDALVNGDQGKEVDLSAYAPPASAQPPSNTFEGNLSVSGVPSVRTIFVDHELVSPEGLAAAQTFPDDFDYAFVQDGNVLLPVRRGFIVTSHPYWDFILEPGRVWNEPGDHGYTRAALPFMLVEKNENCTHAGVMTFLFRDDGSISHAAMQISSETCKYFKFDMWGILKAAYTQHPVAGKARVIEDYEANLAARLPTRPLARLAFDHPGLDPAALALGRTGSRAFHGLVVDGINYVSACPTRRGDYPYCDVLDAPTYSTAKSLEASVAMMSMEQLYPGVGKQSVADFAPVAGCRTAGWAGVTFVDLLNMSSGHFDSPRAMVDEAGADGGPFYSGTTERAKADFACAYPRKAAPGTVWVYHTSDTYLLGDVLNRYLRSLPGRADQDIFRDVVVADVYAPLHLSATARVTRRTMDAAAQPFFGYGLDLHRDDMARIGWFVGVEHGAIDGKQVLDPRMLDTALQRVPDDRGLAVRGLPDYRYKLGFWARDIASVIGCSHPVWVPYMAGYGGISIVMFPNGAVFYSASDQGGPAVNNWASVAIQVNKLGGLCGQ